MDLIGASLVVIIFILIGIGRSIEAELKQIKEHLENIEAEITDFNDKDTYIPDTPIDDEN